MNHTKTKLPSQLETLSEKALEHLLTCAFDEDENLGTIDLPEDQALGDELRGWLMGMSAIPFDEPEDGEQADLLCGFTFDDEAALDTFNGVYQALTRAPIENDIVRFHNRTVTRAALAKKDKDRLNVLKLKEVRVLTPFEKIKSEPNNNPRRKTSRKGLVGLALSITKTGLRHDIAIRPHPTNRGEFLVIYGYRRLLAIEYAVEQNWLPKNFLVGTRLINANDSQARLLAIEENNGREDVDPLDQAEAFAELLTSVTPATLAKQNGMSESALKSLMTLAFDCSPIAKAAYREGIIALEQLKALSVGSFAKQDDFLKGNRYNLGMRGEYIVGMMLQSEFSLGSALFTLEQYKAAGGEIEEHMFYPNAHKFTSLGIVAELQRAALETQKVDFLAQGYGEVIISQEPAVNLHQMYARASQQTPLQDRVVLMELLPDLTTRVSKDVIRLSQNDQPSNQDGSQTTASHSTSPAQPNQSNGISNPPNKTEEATLTERAAQIIKRTKTSAIQTAIMTKGNHHLVSALTVYALIDSNHTLLQRRSASSNDFITSPVVLAALEGWSNRIPQTAFSPQHGISSNHKAGSEIFEQLMTFNQSELDELLQVLIASSIADWNTSPHNIATGKTGSDKLAQILANHLDIKGHEGWEANTEYYQALGHHKQSLEPHLVKAFGAVTGKNLLASSTKTALTDELVKARGKLSNWTPPELAFGDSGISLEANCELSSPEPSGDTFVPKHNFENDFSHAISAD